jgi:outer membrane protein TolC
LHLATWKIGKWNDFAKNGSRRLILFIKNSVLKQRLEKTNEHECRKWLATGATAAIGLLDVDTKTTIMKKIFYSFILLISVVTAKAQVTMMNDVSASYLERLIQIAKDNYPKFKWTNARVAAAKAGYDKTKYGIFDFAALSYVYYPGNNFEVYNASNSGTNSFLNGYQLGLFINVGTMLQKPATIKQAKEEYIAAKYDRETIDLDIEQEVRKRYFTYVEMSNVLKIKSKAVGDADDAMKHVKYKFEKGEVTFEIYNQALLAFSTYSQEKIIAESSFLVAKSSLEEMLGTSLEKIK